MSPFGIHDDTMFPRTGANPQIVVFNYGTSVTEGHSIAAADVLCYFATTGQQALGIIKAASGTTLEGGWTYTKQAERKVMGIAMEDISPLSTGVMALGGIVSLNMVGPADRGDWLKLSASAGKATKIAAATKLGGVAFGKILETVLGGTAICWLWTHRI